MDETKLSGIWTPKSKACVGVFLVSCGSGLNYPLNQKEGSAEDK